MIWYAPFDTAAVNWSTFVPIANISTAEPAPLHGGGQGQQHPIMDVFSPALDGERLMVVFHGSNSPDYGRFHFGAIRWKPDAPVPSMKWAWQASPGGAWNVSNCLDTVDDGAVFNNLCVNEPDGSLDRCGGHYPCAGSQAMVIGQDVIKGFNGEGWQSGQAHQYLHFDGETGLLIGHFGRPNQWTKLYAAAKGSYREHYVQGGYDVPGIAGNDFSPSLVNTSTDQVYLYHNDESSHGGVHRWKLAGLDSVRRLVAPMW